LHQEYDSRFLVMNRETNISKILSANFSFVNNHFWNCYEEGESLIVDTVAATDSYLDAYFSYRLQEPPAWSDMFLRPQRCHIHISAGQITCNPLLEDVTRIFDYPTFNPMWKMQKYRYVYGISPHNSTSKWFDTLVKIDVTTRAVEKQWHAPGVYLTEAGFIPVTRNTSPGRRGGSLQQEDSGILLSVAYNASSDTSFVAIYDAQSLRLLDQYSLEQVIPFHAHGISCVSGECFTNP